MDGLIARGFGQLGHHFGVQIGRKEAFQIDMRKGCVLGRRLGNDP